MSTKVKPQIVFDSIIVELTKVSFKKLENLMSQYKIKTANNLSVKTIDEHGFVLKSSRELSFEPQGAFTVRVEFDIICKFDSKSKQHYAGNVSEIEKFIEKRKIEILNNTEVGSLTSILISQITLVNNHKPLVLPPFMNHSS